MSGPKKSDPAADILERLIRSEEENAALRAKLEERHPLMHEGVCPSGKTLTYEMLLGALVRHHGEGNGPAEVAEGLLDEVTGVLDLLRVNARYLGDDVGTLQGGVTSEVLETFANHMAARLRLASEILIGRSVGR